jgi:hypothetical protein
MCVPAQENKTIVAIFDAVGETPAQYAQLIEALEAAGAGHPQGRLYHVSCAKEGGYLVVDVWASVEQLNQFAATLGPLIQSQGGTPAAPQIYPVVNIIQG